jgi:flagellar motility protein MotE (MotC chaperone)
MIKLLTSNWTAALLGSVVYVLSTVAFWKTPVIPQGHGGAEQPGAAANRLVPSWDFVNPEADQLMAELRVEKKSLEKKEQQLNDLAMRLESERTELNQATQSVHQLQLDFDKNVVRIQDEETANLKKLAKVYADMTPESAASVFSQMDDPAVIKIMVFMKDTETAAVLEAMAKTGTPEAKRVAALSESLRLTAFRNTPATSTPK